MSSGHQGTSTEITPEELHRRRTAGESIRVIDVRQPHEAAICRIDGAELIPLMELPMRLVDLDPDEEIVVLCKMGGRSSQAAEFLRVNGFRKVRNLTGGILRWIDNVDPTMTKY